MLSDIFRFGHLKIFFDKKNRAFKDIFRQEKSAIIGDVHAGGTLVKVSTHRYIP